MLYVLLTIVTSVQASHCYNYADCQTCVGNTQGSACSYCGITCQMATDACTATTNLQQGATTCPVIPYTPPPGVDFFTAVSSATFQTNPAQRNYGVAITDVDGDDRFEALIAGYGVSNQLFKYDTATSKLVDVAASFGIEDEQRKAIGVVACDTDGDGVEEIYVLNTDQYSGVTATSDRLYRKGDTGKFADLFELEQNKNEANYVAGRSCACVDSNGDGKYAVMVANYGGAMRLFTQKDGSVTDRAVEAGVARTTGGRALVSGPILTNRYDIFANNEGPSNRRRRHLLSHRANYMFENKCDAATTGSYSEVAESAGLKDPNFTGRGTALLDSNRDGLLDIVYGNWLGDHRLFLQSRGSAVTETPTFTDVATADMKETSRVRTVIAADFDNDGNEEIFFNNIPGDNRLFKKVHGVDADWIKINIGAAREPTGHGTGAAIFDMDGDGVLELLISHGESAAEPLTLYRASSETGVQNNAYLRILPKTKSGAPARGAIVTLKGEKDNQMRVIDSGSGYLCQMEPVAHFGLGSDTEAAATWSVTVQWPDGVRVTSTLTKNAMHIINYPAVGTQVQYIGCARSSVETTCMLSDSQCGEETSAAPTSGDQGDNAESEKNDATEKNDSDAEKNDSESSSTPSSSTSPSEKKNDIQEDQSTSLESGGVTNTTTRSGGIVHSISCMFVGFTLMSIAMGL